MQLTYKTFISVFFLVVAISICSKVRCQDTSRTLTNEDIVKMVQSGMPTDSIVFIIGRSKTAFNISTDDLIELGRQNVRGPVLDAMVKAKSQQKSQDEINYSENEDTLRGEHTFWRAEGDLQSRLKILILSSSSVLEASDPAPAVQVEGVGDLHNAWRFLNCVSRSMVAEFGLKPSLFSVSSITTTYKKLASTLAIPGTQLRQGISFACQILVQYSDDLQRAQLDANKATKKLPKDIEESTWHEVRLAWERKEHPSEDAEANIRAEDAKYCMFGPHCTS